MSLATIKTFSTLLVKFEMGLSPSGSVTKEAGITIPVPVIITFLGTVNNELRLAD